MKIIEHIIVDFDRNGLVPEVGNKFNEIINAINELDQRVKRFENKEQSEQEKLSEQFRNY